MGWTRPHYYSLTQAYTYYRKNREDKKGGVLQPEYKDIVHAFFGFLMEKVFEGESVKLPQKMGNLSIVGRKIEPKFDEEGRITNLPVDWKATKEMWASNPKTKEEKRVVRHLNEHSNGIFYFIKWSRSNVLFMNKNLYSFTPTRKNSRTVPRLIEQGKSFLINRYIAKDKR